MEILIILFGILAAFAVPLGLIATVQYCVLAKIELGFNKLLIFSWTMAIAVIPFSFFYTCYMIFASLEETPTADNFFILISAGYLFFGWLVCSALYGKMIFPDFFGDEIKLP